MQEHKREFKFIKHRANSVDQVDLRLEGKNKYKKELDCIKRNYGTDIFFSKVINQNHKKKRIKVD